MFKLNYVKLELFGLISSSFQIMTGVYLEQAATFLYKLYIQSSTYTKCWLIMRFVSMVRLSAQNLSGR